MPPPEPVALFPETVLFCTTRGPAVSVLNPPPSLLLPLTVLLEIVQLVTVRVPAPDMLTPPPFPVTALPVMVRPSRVRRSSVLRIAAPLPLLRLPPVSRIPEIDTVRTPVP